MILQALARYYDILLEEGNSDDDIPLPGYSVANVHYGLNLSEDGELLDIFSLMRDVPRGKKMVPKARSMIVPEQQSRSGKTPPAYFLCDNNAYVLGISPGDANDPNYNKQRFEAFCKLNKDLLSKANCLEAKAVKNFLERYTPANAQNHPVIARYYDEIMKAGKANFVFMFRGEYVHKNAEICRIWEEATQTNEDDYVGQCLVTGEIAAIAPLHYIKIKGIPPHQGGVSLVGFNDRAYESYNRTNGQGLNSPVSKKAMLAYSKALNHLLSDSADNKKIIVGSTTVVYWAESTSQACAELFSGLFQSTLNNESAQPGRDEQGERLLKDIAQKIKRGHPIDEKSLSQVIDGNTRFYVLGLEAPNRGRAAVRFFYSDSFLKIVRKVAQHYSDMQVGEGDEREMYHTPYRIVDETVSKKAKNAEPSPLLAGALFRSIFTSSPYPAALYYGIINRIRADIDDEDENITKINHLRVAVIKAYLIRKYQQRNPFEEVLTMSLNDKSAIPAYILGRLFAVLEDLQIEAAKPSKLNSTIKDHYFTSACASPKSVFPTLLRLSQHHISKSQYGYVSDNRIEDLMGLLDVEKTPIPARLTLDEQGIFVLGYYHQRAAFYVKNNAATASISTETK